MSPILRTGGRWLSPTTLVLVGLCFALPFVTVSCDTPDGFGQAARGGTTEYTGVDLAVGGRPDVNPPDRIRPTAAQRDESLPPQPAAIVVLALVVAGVGAAIAIPDARARRAATALAGGLAGTALLVNQALVESEVALRVADEVGPLTDGRTARDLVNAGAGFVVALVLLVLVALGNVVGWWRIRSGSGQKNSSSSR